MSALPSVIVLLAFGLVGAAVWAQILEGSSTLSRPFGYYGSVLGVALGGVLLWISGEPVLLPLAALSLAAPWVQAVGRVRCLIQGCCHGKPTTARLGIRVNNPHSRVCAIAGLAGKPVHPTQLYSIISNILIGPLLAGLWLSAAPLTMVIGAYLALAGIARFTEEGYRGEPQTQRIAGLSIYQWLSIASLVAGMWTMTVRSPSAGARLLSPARVAVATGVANFLVCWFALGMDVPKSRRRFARLSG